MPEGPRKVIGLFAFHGWDRFIEDLQVNAICL